MRMAVVGGTGLVGRYVVAEVTSAGHEPVVVARSTGADVATGRGLDEALTGADVVIDVSNVTTRKRSESVAFFAAATEHLLAAGQRAGVRHHVALSIVGIDRVNLAYYEGKRHQEAVLLASGRPVSVLRASQFHEFAAQLLAGYKGRLVVLPKMRTQPIAAREVATELVRLAAGEPVGMAPDLAGPQQEILADLVRRVLDRLGQRRPVITLPLPMAGARAMAAGGNLPTGDFQRGTQTFSEWLATDDLDAVIKS